MADSSAKNKNEDEKSMGDANAKASQPAPGETRENIGRTSNDSRNSDSQAKGTERKGFPIAPDNTAPSAQKAREDAGLETRTPGPRE